MAKVAFSIIPLQIGKSIIYLLIGCTHHTCFWYNNHLNYSLLKSLTDWSCFYIIKYSYSLHSYFGTDNEIIQQLHGQDIITYYS